MASCTRIVAVVYVLLAAISVILIDLRVVLVPAAFACVALVAAGLGVLRPGGKAIALRWPASSEPGEENNLVLVIGGASCPLQGYEQDLYVRLRLRHVPELAACCVLSLAALPILIRTTVSWSTLWMPQLGAFQVEFICFAGLIVLLACLRWFLERRFLSKSYFAIGGILGIDPGFFRAGVTYQFFDFEGGRRGGKAPLALQPNDNAVLVLYDRKDPDSNMIHGAFVFHRFQINLLPGRRRTAEKL